MTNQKHDIIGIHISDPSESTLPAAGWITLEDAETGELVEINTSDPKVRAQYAKAAAERRESRKKMLNRAGLDMIEAETGKPYFIELKKFFERRIMAKNS